MRANERLRCCRRCDPVGGRRGRFVHVGAHDGADCCRITRDVPAAMTGMAAKRDGKGWLMPGQAIDGSVPLRLLLPPVRRPAIVKSLSSFTSRPHGLKVLPKFSWTIVG